MKNILNWTFGSFFRTIGRIACYLIIGGIIAYFMSDGFSNGNFRFTDLFGIQKVSADTLYNNRWFTFYNDSGRTNALPTSNNLYQYIQLTSTGTSINGQNIYFNEPIQKTSYYDYITIPYLITGSNSGEAAFDTMNYHCSILETQQNGANVYVPYSCTYLNANSSQYMPVEVNFTFSITLITDGGGLTNCKLESDQIKCYLTSGYNYVGFTFYYSTTNMNNVTNPLRIHFQHVVGLQKDSSNAIVEEQEKTTNAINSVNQTLTDTNSTSEANDTYSFFNSYDNESESQLSQVISAPLTLLNNLIVGTDTKLCFTLKGKQTCIPSGRMIWGKTSRTSIHSGNATFTPHPFSNDGNITNGISAFIVLFNLVVGGFLAYKMLLSLYRMVDDMLNPTNNRIEVLRL